MAVIDSYTEANYSTAISVDAFNANIGQSFTGDGSTLGSVQLYLRRDSAASSSMTVAIYAHAGTFGSTGTWTGSALATSSAVAASTVPSSIGLVSFPFTGGNQITLTNATKYFLVLRGLYPDDADIIYFGIDTTSPSHGGNFASDDFDYGTVTANAAYDLIFYVNTAEAGPTFIAQSNQRPIQAVRRASSY